MIPQHVFPETARINTAGHLEIGGSDVTVLAEQYGTPLYIFDEYTLRQASRRYSSAFKGRYKGTVAFSYASKSLMNTSLARLLIEEDFGFDAVSICEVRAVLLAGAKPECVHLHGNAKPRSELQHALELGVGRIVVDNLDELELLVRLTENRCTPQGLLVRIEPAVATVTHVNIQTGQRGSKFGLGLGQLDAFARTVKTAPHLELKGLHFHLGSQLFDLDAYRRAIAVLFDVAVYLRDKYSILVKELSPGGGLAAAYLDRDETPSVDALAEQVCHSVEHGCEANDLPLPHLVLEPGRSISARAGVAVYQVIGSKPLDASEMEPATRYVHVDGGIGDNPRPALYGARYTALLANHANAPATETVHIAGRYCESGDVLMRETKLPKTKPGDLIALGAAGAYTLSLSSNYNMVPRPTVLFVKDGQARLVQRRETFEDLIARDALETNVKDPRGGSHDLILRNAAGGRAEARVSHPSVY